MKFQKTEIKNERPGIMLTIGVPASPVASADEDANEQELADANA